MTKLGMTKYVHSSLFTYHLVSVFLRAPYFWGNKANEQSFDLISTPHLNSQEHGKGNHSNWITVSCQNPILFDTFLCKS